MATEAISMGSYVYWTNLAWSTEEYPSRQAAGRALLDKEPRRRSSPIVLTGQVVMQYDRDGARLIPTWTHDFTRIEENT